MDLVSAYLYETGRGDRVLLADETELGLVTAAGANYGIGAIPGQLYRICGMRLVPAHVCILAAQRDRTAGLYRMRLGIGTTGHQKSRSVLVEVALGIDTWTARTTQRREH